VLPDLQRQYSRNFRLMVLPFDGHFDEEGNRFIARQLARAMLGP